MAQNRDNIPSPCPFCDKVYEWRRGLRRHLLKYHQLQNDELLKYHLEEHSEKILQQTNTPKTQHGAQS
jgi:hypothetical protein